MSKHYCLRYIHWFYNSIVSKQDCEGLEYNLWVLIGFLLLNWHTEVMATWALFTLLLNAISIFLTRFYHFCDHLTGSPFKLSVSSDFIVECSPLMPYRCLIGGVANRHPKSLRGSGSSFPSWGQGETHFPSPRPHALARTNVQWLHGTINVMNCVSSHFPTNFKKVFFNNPLCDACFRFLRPS